MQRTSLTRFLRQLVLAALPAVGAVGCCSSDTVGTEHVSVDAFSANVPDGGSLPDAACARVCASSGRADDYDIVGVEGCRAVDFNDGGAIVGVDCEDRLGRCSFLPGGRPPAGLRARGPGRARDEVGAFFAAMAHVEGAAVEGFAQLVRELALHGAPARLIEAADRASDDEGRHARIACALARRAGAVPPPIVVDSVAPRTLEAIAVDNAVEGCVTETFGAVVALWQAESARDRAVRSAFTRIAVDELRHAELARSVATWIRPRLSSGSRRRAREALWASAERLAQAIQIEAPRRLIDEVGLPSASAGHALFRTMRRALWT